jgi:hypothetical protein
MSPACCPGERSRCLAMEVCSVLLGVCFPALPLQTFCDIDMLVYASVWLPWPFAEVRSCWVHKFEPCLTRETARKLA